MTMGRTPVLTLAAVATLAVAGCGGGGAAEKDGGSAEQNGGTLTHATFTTRANAACQQASTAMARLAAPASLSGLAGYADRARAIGTALDARLASMTPPAADAEGFTRYRGGLHTANAALVTMKAAAAQNDRPGVRSAVERIAAAQVGILATQAGLGTCATATAGPAS
jgi:hypothetical protein